MIRINDPFSLLDSPIQTLAESIQDPIHEFITIPDLIEAYNVFSIHLRKILTTADTSNSPPYVTSLEANSAVFTDVVCRDISCFLSDSFPSRPESYPDQSYLDDDSYQSIDDSGDGVENNMLCCHALRAAADICAVPCVLASLTDIERSRLINAIFEVSRFPQSPIFNWKKVDSLVVSLFKFQQLPWDTMRTKQREVCILIQERLQHSSAQHRADAAIILRSMLLRYPKFIKGFTNEFLPTVLEQLVDSSSNARIHAASALSAFAILKVKSDFNGYPEEEIYQALRAFIDKYTSKRKRRCDRLSAYLNSALAEEEFWDGKGTAFAIVLASSIILIQGHRFFSNPQSAALVYQVIPRLHNHTDRNSRGAHTELWRLSIWAFSKMPLCSDTNTDDTSALWDRIYGTLKQVLDCGLGIQLIHVLMKNSEELTNEELVRTLVNRAVLLVEEMVTHTNPLVRTDGFNALCALLKDVGLEFSIAPHRPQETSNPGVAFSVALADGTLLEQKPGHKFKLRSTHVDVSIIKPLSEQNIMDHWNEMIDIWATSANDVVHGKNEFTSDYIRAWQALLLVQTQLTQGNVHLEPTPTFCDKIATIVAGLAVHDDSVDIQANSLSFISKLWNTMKNTFAQEWLSSAAEIIVTSLLNKPFSLGQQSIQRSWSNICADLVAFGNPTILHVLHAGAAGAHEEPDRIRLLWHTLSRGGNIPFEEAGWHGMVQFLLIPFGAWELSEEEFGVWQTMFQSTLGVAEKCGHSSNHVVEHLCDHLDERRHQGLKESTKALYFLVSKVASPLPPGLIKFIDEVLVLNYSPVIEKKNFGFNLLRLLGRMVKTVEPTAVVAFLEDIQNAALIWIRDRDSILAAYEHEELMVTFYAHCLDSLSKDVPSVRSLEKLEPLICSCFDQADAVGLDVFSKFWRATYHQHPIILPKHLPQKIRKYLQAWNDVFDESLGFSPESRSIAHDSSPRDSQFLRSPCDVNEKVDSTFLFEQEPSLLLEQAKGSNRSGTVTPTQSRPWHVDKTLSEGKSALDARIRELEEETSQDGGLMLANTPSPIIRDRSNLLSPTNKRAAEWQDISPAPKRRKSNPEYIPFSLTRPNLSTLRSAFVTGEGSVMAQRRVSSSGRSVSSGEPSTTTTPSWLRSQNNMTRAMTKIGALSRVHDGLQSQRDHVPSDDYDTWEQPVSVGHLKEVKAEMASSDDIVPDSEEAIPEDEEVFPTEYGNDNDADGQLASPFASQGLARSRKRERSQTAPEPGLMWTAQAGDSPDRPQMLRRNHTAGDPFQNKKSTSAQQLEVLHATYAALSTARESQIDDEDIIRAKEVTSNINLLLEQRILARLGRGGSKNR